jgi:hypothetical protein
MRGHAEKSDGHLKSAVAHNLSAQQKRNVNAAQLQGPGIIQRYAMVQPDNLKAKKGSTIETQHIQQTNYGSTYASKTNEVAETVFAPQTTSTVTERVSGNVQQPRNSSLPDFKVAQDGVLAVPADGQSRNFYGTETKIDEGNQALIDKGSDVRLKAQGAGIRVPKNPYEPSNDQTRNLKKIHAATKVADNDNKEIGTEIAQVFPADTCNMFIKSVLGSLGNATRIAILKNKHEQIQVQSAEGTEPVGEISTLVSEELRSPLEAEQILKTKLSTEEQNTGKRNYEALPDKERQVRAKELGINEYVDPQVGEGMVIKSMETNSNLDFHERGGRLKEPQLLKGQVNDDLKSLELRTDYMQALNELDYANNLLSKSRLDVSYNVQEMMKTWGVHYAGVVAREGPDMVTLENYNRKIEIGWEHQRIFNNLFRDFDDFRVLVSQKVDSLDKTPDESLIQQLVQLAAEGKGLEGNYQLALEEAIESFQTGLRSTRETTVGNFYFEMYGPKEQSFHSVYKGLSTNPVTLHIKESPEILKQETIQGLQSFKNKISKWEDSLLIHPVFPVQNTFKDHIAQAHLAEQKIAGDLLNANTQAEYGAINELLSGATRTFVISMRGTIAGAYKIITGEKPEEDIYNVEDVPAPCKKFLSTYSFYHFADYSYGNIKSLLELAEDLIGKGIIH